MQNPICHLAPDWMNWNARFQTNRVGCQKFQQIRTNPAQGQFEKNSGYKAICILRATCNLWLHLFSRYPLCAWGNWCVTCMFWNRFTSRFLGTTPADSSSQLLRGISRHNASYISRHNASYISRHKCTHNSSHISNGNWYSTSLTDDLGIFGDTLQGKFAFMSDLMVRNISLATKSVNMGLMLILTGSVHSMHIFRMHFWIHFNYIWSKERMIDLPIHAHDDWSHFRENWITFDGAEVGFWSDEYDQVHHNRPPYTWDAWCTLWLISFRRKLRH